jgi:hypothetical protein
MIGTTRDLSMGGWERAANPITSRSALIPIDGLTQSAISSQSKPRRPPSDEQSEIIGICSEAA